MRMISVTSTVVDNITNLDAFAHFKNHNDIHILLCLNNY